MQYFVVFDSLSFIMSSSGSDEKCFRNCYGLMLFISLSLKDLLTSHVSLHRLFRLKLPLVEILYSHTNIWSVEITNKHIFCWNKICVLWTPWCSLLLPLVSLKIFKVEEIKIPDPDNVFKSTLTAAPHTCTHHCYLTS